MKKGPLLLQILVFNTLYLKELFENRTVEAENELVRVDVDVVLGDEGHVGQVPGLMNFC